MSHQPPRFSVVVPTYLRPQQLAVCLRALSRLRYPRDRFEVIVADDGRPTPRVPSSNRTLQDNYTAPLEPTPTITFSPPSSRGVAGIAQIEAGDISGYIIEGDSAYKPYNGRYSERVALFL
jgi:hypothetical protein